mmetsp:Transcript_137727/g.343746  ORF Transcript_137727/g.343746 Transcript_137727/m.343746 type:complete len:633 (+) Transcript_137727:77-1975(+)
MPTDLFGPVQSFLQGRGVLDDVEKALVEGADPDAWQGPLTPLRCAVQVHHIRLLQLLLKRGANANQKDEKGVGALHMAVFDGKKECTILLLDATADPNITDKHGQTPLFFAPTRQICELLISRQADLNIRNSKQHSPLHFAAHAGLNGAATWLLDSDAKMLEAKDAQGHTPLFYAEHSRMKSTLTLLQQKSLSASRKPEAALPDSQGAEDVKQKEAELAAQPQREAAAVRIQARFRGGVGRCAVEEKRKQASASAAAAAAPAPAEVTPAEQRAATEEQSAKVPGETSEHMPEAEPGVSPVSIAGRSAASTPTANVLMSRQLAALRARQIPSRQASPSQAAASIQAALDEDSEDSEEARRDNRIPNRDVKQTAVDGCLTWEVSLRKESEKDKFGFVQANGKLEFEARLVNPSRRSPSPGSSGPKTPTRPPEDCPLPGPQVLIVRRIHEGALLHRWNQRHPQIAVKAQDRITSINGESTVDGMQAEIRNPKIHIRFQRYPDRFTVELKKNGQRLGFRFERPAPGVQSEEIRIIEVLAQGALPDYNKQQVEAEHWQFVVLPDMRITAANAVRGEAGEIAEELKRCDDVKLEIRRAEHVMQTQAQVRNKMRMLAKLIPDSPKRSISPSQHSAPPQA